MASEPTRIRALSLGEAVRQLTPEEIREGDERERTERRETWEREQEAKREDHLLASGVRQEERDALMGRQGLLDDNTARRAVREFMADRSRVFLLLLGTVGSGKTVAGCEAMLGLKRKVVSPYFGESWGWDRPGVWVRAKKLAALSSYGDGRAEFERIARAPFLVLDEVGGEGALPFASVFDELVDERYADHLRTVITGNLDAERFKALYGERAVSRIRQYGSVVVCREADYRARRP